MCYFLKYEIFSVIFNNSLLDAVCVALDIKQLKGLFIESKKTLKTLFGHIRAILAVGSKSLAWTPNETR